MIRFLAGALVALGLRALAVLALLAAALAPALLAPVAPRTVVVAAAAGARTEAAALAERLRRLPSVRAVLPSGAALADALRRLAPGAAGVVVYVGDGRGVGDDLGGALAAARRAGVELYWRAPPAAVAAARLRAVDAPAAAESGQPLTLTAHVAAARAIRLRVRASDELGGTAESVQDAAAGGDFVVPLTLAAAAPGDRAYTVTLADADGASSPLDAATVVVRVHGRGRVLYVGAATAPLAASLAAGGWPLDVAAPARVTTQREVLARYSAVVLDDLPVGDAPAELWPALAAAVGEEGVGLVTLGGPQSFGAGGYRNSRLEPLLPLRAEPPAEEQRAAVAFVVDKSGSMGRGSAGVDRLALARSAVLESAATLGGRDRVALVSFDVEPRLLVPLAEVDTARARIEAPWPIAAGGGTRIVPALALAAAELARAERGRRFLVLITDGFVGEEPLGEVVRRLAAERIQLIVLAIGADANVAALARVGRELDAELLRVGDVAELPRFARRALERRIAPLEEGAQAVRELAPLPGFVATGGWPGVRGLALTRPQAGARVLLASGGGAPLLAVAEHGSGRTLALPAGLGEWTPDWLRWRDWPRLAGALIGWTARRDDDATLTLNVEERDAALVITADLASGAEWSREARLALRVRRPSGRSEDLDAEPNGPGRFRAVVAAGEAGAYRITALADRARRTVVHVIRPATAPTAADASLDAAVGGGLLERWRDEVPDRWARGARDADAGRRRGIVLALALLFAALLTDDRSGLARPIGALLGAAARARAWLGRRRGG